MGFLYAIYEVFFEEFYIEFNPEDPFYLVYGNNVWTVVDMLGGMHPKESA